MLKMPEARQWEFRARYNGDAGTGPAHAASPWRNRSPGGARRLLTRLAVIFMLAAGATGCTTVDEWISDESGNNDPFEEINRVIFEVNLAGDKIILKPLAIMYRTFIPPPLRQGVRNALKNLSTPVIFANDVLQGEGERGYITVTRFLINTTLGLGGIMDIAAELDFESHNEDFGQTLAVWGLGDEFYIMAPLIGPSNPRDLFGLLVDGFLDPLGYVAPTEALIARAGIRGVDQREEVLDVFDEIERTSLDFYATVRSLYRQRRLDLIRNGDPGPLRPINGDPFDEFPDFEDFDDSEDFD
jgi:phospholipid-binding lipoprotein MlaA